VDDVSKIDNLLLIDGHGLAFRGFFALPEMNAPDGTPTNAVLGFMNMLLKAVDKWSPDGIGLFFDPKGPTARDAMYEAYKEGRRPTPEEFKVQMPLILELVEMLGYPVFIEEGVEADDLIAATAMAAAREGADVLVLSADKDLLQILRPGLRLARPTKGISEFNLYDEESFTREYGFHPTAMADYLALVGDSVDNIPGVPGIGDKTARQLLAKYGALNAIYGLLESLPDAQRKKLESGKESAYMSYELIVPQAVSAVSRELLRMRQPDVGAALEMCERLGLKRLISRLKLQGEQYQSTAVRPVAESAATTSAQGADPCELLPPPVLSQAREVFLEKTLILGGDPDIVMTAEGKWADLDEGAIELLREWLSAREGKKLILAGYGLWCDNIPILADSPGLVRDVELAHYFFHPDAKDHSFESITGGNPAAGRAKAARTLALWNKLSAGSAGDMERVMAEIDTPLVPVLRDLERRGFYVDLPSLWELEEELAEHISATEREIWDVAGGEINLNSPKQVGELLFEKLRLPAVKRTKTGFSTDVGVLEELSRLPEPLCEIPSMMLDFRECSKMSSGFVQPFMKYAESSPDGRIHSKFLHTVTGTARLASRDPNAQNMPVFGEWAVKFRSAIRPGPGEGRVFVAADYSQIELRVLAHLSGEERLLDAFANGRDVHLETASWVFDMAPEDITPEQRRFAKTVNFGLIYGMGAHGLAGRMGITRPQAAGLIKRYFSVLPRVKGYLERSAREAKAQGFTKSVFGRIRPLSEVSTVEGRGGNSMDRVAVNTPIQSAAADIAKIALIRFHRVISRDHPEVFLVLQVHDSLICEAPKEKADEIEALLVRTMEDVKYIDVPLVAEPKRGNSLADV
jgi:DNA polymerase-1